MSKELVQMLFTHTIMIPLALQLNRQTCRKYVENNFSVSQMVNGYEAVYRQIIKDRIKSNGRIHAAKIHF